MIRLRISLHYHKKKKSPHNNNSTFLFSSFFCFFHFFFPNISSRSTLKRNGAVKSALTSIPNTFDCFPAEHSPQTPVALSTTGAHGPYKEKR